MDTASQRPSCHYHRTKAFIVYLLVLLLWTTHARPARTQQQRIVSDHAGLLAAFRDFNVTHIRVAGGFVVRNSNASYGGPLLLERNVLVEGAIKGSWDAYPRLDFTFASYAQCQLGPGVVLTFRRLTLVNLLSIAQLSPRTFFAPSAASSSLVWEDVVHRRTTCPPLDVIRQQWAHAAGPPGSAAGGSLESQRPQLRRPQQSQQSQQRLVWLSEGAVLCGSSGGSDSDSSSGGSNVGGSTESHGSSGSDSGGNRGHQEGQLLRRQQSCCSPVLRGLDVTVDLPTGGRTHWNNTLLVCDGFLPPQHEEPTDEECRAVVARRQLRELQRSPSPPQQHQLQQHKQRMLLALAQGGGTHAAAGLRRAATGMLHGPGVSYIAGAVLLLSLLASSLVLMLVVMVVLPSTVCVFFGRQKGQPGSTARTAGARAARRAGEGGAETTANVRGHTTELQPSGSGPPSVPVVDPCKTALQVVMVAGAAGADASGTGAGRAAVRTQTSATECIADTAPSDAAAPSITSSPAPASIAMDTVTTADATTVDATTVSTCAACSSWETAAATTSCAAAARVITTPATAVTAAAGFQVANATVSGDSSITASRNAAVEDSCGGCYRPQPDASKGGAALAAPYQPKVWQQQEGQQQEGARPVSTPCAATADARDRAGDPSCGCTLPLLLLPSILRRQASKTTHGASNTGQATVTIVTDGDAGSTIGGSLNANSAAVEQRLVQARGELQQEQEQQQQLQLHHRQPARQLCAPAPLPPQQQQQQQSPRQSQHLQQQPQHLQPPLPPQWQSHPLTQQSLLSQDQPQPTSQTTMLTTSVGSLGSAFIALLRAMGSRRGTNTSEREQSNCGTGDVECDRPTAGTSTVMARGSRVCCEDASTTPQSTSTPAATPSTPPMTVPMTQTVPPGIPASPATCEASAQGEPAAREAPTTTAMVPIHRRVLRNNTGLAAWKAASGRTAERETTGVDGLRSAGGLRSGPNPHGHAGGGMRMASSRFPTRALSSGPDPGCSDRPSLSEIQRELERLEERLMQRDPRFARQHRLLQEQRKERRSLQQDQEQQQQEGGHASTLQQLEAALEAGYFIKER
ncbi:hypothetical protein Agub_g10054 [Astrephomene gubernaculifera]|uniref:Uncharacterized protein n=1 Tax=Astrephomene gubernaculifera TaxID=47775 RepID=A0AAD3DWD7_9CHLO|nr:hypothetical protein Agub_g10054 [Astrephomene gubernaculifera]